MTARPSTRRDSLFPVRGNKLRRLALAIAALSAAAPAVAEDGRVVGAAALGVAIGAALLGQQPPGEKSADHPWYGYGSAGTQAGQLVHGGQEQVSCGPGEVAQRYPGWKGAVCQVSPTARSSPPRPAQTDKEAS
jgi:hypothetical protein